MSLYKQKGSTLWWVNISHPGVDRIRRSTGTDDRVEAQRVHDEIKAELWKTAPKLKGRTWGQAVLHWCAKETRSDSELLSLKKFGTKFKDRLLINVTRESVHEALSFCETAGTYTRYPMEHWRSSKGKWVSTTCTSSRTGGSLLKKSRLLSRPPAFARASAASLSLPTRRHGTRGLHGTACAIRGPPGTSKTEPRLKYFRNWGVGPTSGWS